MPKTKWQNHVLAAGNEDLVWELYHENSKVGRYMNVLSDQEVKAGMQELHESLSYEGYPVVELPATLTPLRHSLAKTITSRVSTRNLTPGTLSLKNLATLLHYAYGVTRDNKDTGCPRPFRTVPSGGALYPLEIFFSSAHVRGLQPGLYHYNPSKRHLRLLRAKDESRRISAAMVQPEIALGASVMIFITAVFERSIFKYGDRGYRFALIEAGHVAQNINLVANALSLSSVNIGGFFDREIDDFLGLDGLTHSTLYMIAVGGEEKRPGMSRGRTV